PDGKYLVSAGGDQVVKLWDITTDKEVRSLRGHRDWVSAVAFSPDGHFIVSAGVDKAVKVWEVAGRQSNLSFGHAQRVLAVAASGELLKKVTGNESQIGCLAFSQGGELAALGDRNGNARFWNVPKAELLPGGDLATHPAGVNDLIFTPDAKRLVTGGGDGEVKIWDLAKRGSPLRTFTAYKEQKVAAFAMCADGKRFVTVGGDNTVKLWELETGKEVRKWDL